MSFENRRLMQFTVLILSGLLILGVSCNRSGNKESQVKHQQQVSDRINIPTFSADSAYAYIEKQLSFGPRVPGTEGHQKCAAWLESKLISFGAELIVQKASVTNWDNHSMSISNFIAQYQPEKANRILLMAHWDTRAVADYDPDPKKRDFPIPGANDGASGVGVLLEIARNLQDHQPALGIDIILFDAEDQGVPEHRELEWTADSWCLGSQYWSKNPHVPNYYARYGILLDMVGGHHAVFTQEEVSVYYAQPVLDKVWKKARELGYGQHFSYEKTPQIVDDHRYVNEIAGIPSIDIIQYDAGTESHFGSYWHTHNDDLTAISKTTLTAVGEVVTHVIFKEK